MKFKHLVFASFVTLLVSGCATATYKTGRYFSAQNVANIERGKTTNEEIKEMFGEPFTKSTVSADEEKWVYTYATGTTKATSYVVSMKVVSNGSQRVLDILFKNNVVANYIFTESNALKKMPHQ